MSKSVNKVILVGHLGRDPEMKDIGAYRVANVGLATSKDRSDKKTGAKVEETTWFNLSFWNKAADTIIQYAKKGDLLYIEGSLKIRKREEGGFHPPDVDVDAFRFLGSSGGAQQASASAGGEQAPSPKPASLDLEDDDIPF